MRIILLVTIALAVTPGFGCSSQTAQLKAQLDAQATEIADLKAAKRSQEGNSVRAVGVRENTASVLTATETPNLNATTTTTPKLSANEQAEFDRYADKFLPILEEFKGARALLDQITESLTKDKSAANRARAQAQLSTFSRTAMKVSLSMAALFPPRSARTMHSCFTEGFNIYQQGATKLEFGFIANAEDQIRESFSILQAADTKLKECTELVPE
ncbi:MAG: hypothetical protein M1358_09445 [Chloroflexi bacterium]|nr:hypothetical protein [Chloroflexota bacterium]